MSSRKIPRLTDPGLVLIDVQPGFAPPTDDAPALDGLWLRLERLLVMAGCLDLPTVATFERPAKNGWLPPACEAVWPKHGRRFEKSTYDCCGEPEIATAIRAMERRQLLVAGAETDVCVLLSALSMLELGYEVFLLEDCLFTTEPHPGPALHRLCAAGAVPCTLKTAFYELMKTVAVYGQPERFPPAWARLVEEFGEPELFPPWRPTA